MFFPLDHSTAGVPVSGFKMVDIHTSSLSIIWKGLGDLLVRNFALNMSVSGLTLSTIDSILSSFLGASISSNR